HDSPDRVNVADVRARENGIILIGNPTDKVPIFQLETGFGVRQTEPGFVELKLPQIDCPVRIIHTAFANEIRLKEYFGEDKQQSLQESLETKWKQLAETYCDKKGVNVLTTHLFMRKPGGETPEEPDGEKPLNIGNADVVFSNAIPREIQYAALGHLHRYQDVGIHQPATYSGSPLAFSFAEAGQQKYVTLLDIEPGKKAQIERIPLQSGKALKRKTFGNIDDAIDWLQAHKDVLVELTLETDTFVSSEDRKRLY